MSVCLGFLLPYCLLQTGHMPALMSSTCSPLVSLMTPVLPYTLCGCMSEGFADLKCDEAAVRQLEGLEGASKRKSHDIADGVPDTDFDRVSDNELMEGGELDLAHRRRQSHRPPPAPGAVLLHQHVHP
eukprot:TRINITY_DN805_c0_g1_i12.p3 TRINITY_DN805_c0_g1~~TRINITY_DN805_c0_g1_i12.p3  ORF type:complete len:128 (+),score=26.11 TRINITY_DN805_c0_g1_i12:203-586(+)